MQTKIVAAFVLQSSKLLMKWDYLASQLCSSCAIHGFDGGGTLCVCVFSVTFWVWSFVVLFAFFPS